MEIIQRFSQQRREKERSMVMKYGLGLWAAGKMSPRAIADLAAAAEASGKDGVFIEDYITYYTGGETYDPWVILAAMAMVTSKIRLGTTVTALPRRRPWKLAREALTIDHLSNGRFTLGVGLGSAEDPLNFDKFGEASSLKQRAEMADEALAILEGLWSGQPFRFRGTHYQVDEVTFLPTPLQKPRLPIWVGGGWPGPAIRRAARYEGFVPYRTPLGTLEPFSPEEVRRMRLEVAQQRAAAGQPDAPFDLVMGSFNEREDAAALRYRQEMEEAGATWWVEVRELPA